MGGCAFGEMASMFALRTAWEMSTNAFSWHFQVGGSAAEELLEQLKVYGKRMHRELVEQARADPKLAGMGSTITGGMLIGTDAFIGHIGDSRAYVWHDGALRQATHDHTQAQQLVDAGVYGSIAETPRHMRHTLVNCLGGNYEDVQVDTHHIQLAHGDRLLLCTDGLSDMVSDAEIALILGQRPAPAEACQALVDAALDHGGRDNVTVILAAIEVVSE